MATGGYRIRELLLESGGCSREAVQHWDFCQSSRLLVRRVSEKGAHGRGSSRTRPMTCSMGKRQALRHDGSKLMGIGPFRYGQED